MILAERVARIEEMRSTYTLVAGRFEWKRALERPRCGWEDIKVYLKGIRFEDLCGS
jgi:hypothetical protein